MTPDPAERPNRIPWPPILFIGTLVTASVLGAIAPLRFSLGDFGQIAGWMMATLGVMLMAWSFLTFRAAKANILPHRGADRLLTHGPFRISRNPIYLSEAVLLLGLGLVTGSLWHWLLTPVFIGAVTRLGVMREETHMAAKFGGDWARYAATVRRWI